MSTFLEYHNLFLKGLWLTARLACTASLLGLLLAFLWIFMQRSPFKIIRGFAITVIICLRAVPELLLIFIIYFSLSDIYSAINKIFSNSEHFISVNPFFAGAIALALVFSVYAAEVIRGALLSINKGQEEAAIAFGLNSTQCFLRIIFPQLFRISIPGLLNIFLITMKDTSLISAIGVADIMNSSKAVAAITRDNFATYMIAALLYLFITSIVTIVTKRLEKSSKWYNLLSHKG